MIVDILIKIKDYYFLYIYFIIQNSPVTCMTQMDIDWNKNVESN